jgi:hypothetical protein
MLSSLKIKQEKKERFLSHLDDWLMFLFTVCGVLISKYIPFIKTGNLETIKVNLPKTGEILAACVVALFVTFLFERVGNKEGKRKNFKKRAFTHLSNGALWFTLINGLL